MSQETAAERQSQMQTGERIVPGPHEGTPTAGLSATAADAVRLGFNPSKSPDVEQIKQRTAELIALMEIIRDRERGLAGREAAVAITSLQTASMWCVLAATKGL